MEENRVGVSDEVMRFLRDYIEELRQVFLQRLQENCAEATFAPLPPEFADEWPFDEPDAH